MRLGTSLALNYRSDLKLFWLSPVVKSPAPSPQSTTHRTGQEMQPHYQKDKTKHICHSYPEKKKYDGGVLCVLLGNLKENKSV